MTARAILVTLLTVQGLGAVFSQQVGPYLGKTFVFAAYYDDTFNPGFRFGLSGGRLRIDVPELSDSKNEEGIFIKSTIDEPYALEKKAPFEYLTTKSSKFVVLHDNRDLCILIDAKTNDSFWGFNEDSPYVHLVKGSLRRTFIGLDGGMTDFQRTSSFLTEKIAGTEYSYTGLDQYYYSIATPWVEGNAGNGVGEWISKRIAKESGQVLILNGFIDAKRPSLYASNSRVKRIRVSTTDSKWDYELDDSPMPQVMKLPQKVVGDVKFTILEVYPGTKYSDTAISAIYFLHEYPTAQ